MNNSDQPPTHGFTMEDEPPTQQAVSASMPKSSEVGVHSLDEFCLTVPDMTSAARFYTAFGLQVRERGNELQLFTAGHSHCWGSLREGPKKHFHHVSFGAYAEDLPRFVETLEHRGIKRLDAPRGFQGDGIWFNDCDGNLVQIRHAVKSSPFAKSITNNATSLPGARGTTIRSQRALVQPRRLAHVVLFCRNVQKSIDFYTKILGLRLSDEARDIAFLHGIHGSDHHLIAFLKSDAPGVHHLSWDMASIQEIGLGAQQMTEAGYHAGWGLGRHVLGSNYFHYVRDPWGSYCEYSSDIDYIPKDHDWQAGHVAPENGFYLWGPEPPKDFSTNYELSAA
jgi:catechol 2,3-dioxygenase-like lactoylglutathione lyase family enzyme